MSFGLAKQWDLQLYCLAKRHSHLLLN